MERATLTVEEVLGGFDAVARLYPNVPPLCMWRAWEVAGYVRFPLRDPVLDVGCGDGAFFRLVHGNIRRVTGIDHAEQAVIEARKSGVYAQVIQAPAQRIAAAVAGERFASAFANCSLEHMDDLPAVLAQVRGALAPGGEFVFSVVTDRFVSWNPLPKLADLLGGSGAPVAAAHVDYHHLVNPLSPAQWARHLRDAGFDRIEHLPIMPEASARVFLLLDNLWHMPAAHGEVGGELRRWLHGRGPGLIPGLRSMFEGLLRMERDFATGCGAIFSARAAR